MVASGQTCGTFSCLITGVLGLFHRSDTTPVWRILRGLETWAAKSLGASQSKHTSMASAVIPPPGFCLEFMAWLPWLLGPLQAIRRKWISSLPVCFGYGVHDSHRDSNWESTLWGYIAFLLCANLSFCLWNTYYVSPLLSKWFLTL